MELTKLAGGFCAFGRKINLDTKFLRQSETLNIKLVCDHFLEFSAVSGDAA